MPTTERTRREAARARLPNGGNHFQVKDVKSFARCHTQLAINTLSAVCTSGQSESARVAAAAELLNRGWGRPGTAEADGEQITIVIRKILEGPGIVEQPSTPGTKAIEGEVLPPESSPRAGKGT